MPLALATDVDRTRRERAAARLGSDLIERKMTASLWPGVRKRQLFDYTMTAVAAWLDLAACHDAVSATSGRVRRPRRPGRPGYPHSLDLLLSQLGIAWVAALAENCDALLPPATAKAEPGRRQSPFVEYLSIVAEWLDLRVGAEYMLKRLRRSQEPWLASADRTGRRASLDRSPKATAIEERAQRDGVLKI